LKSPECQQRHPASDEDFRLQVSTAVSQAIYVLRLVVYRFAKTTMLVTLSTTKVWNYYCLIKPFTTEIPFDEGGMEGEWLVQYAL
jgi:hypothetical protein